MTEQAHNYFNLGGTIRSSTAEETIARVKPFFPIFGITRVANVTGLDTIGIPTYICIRPNSKHLSVSQGKGLTPELAQASAIMETIESYHAENPRAPELFGSFAELQNNYKLLDPQIFNLGFLQAENLAARAMGWAQATDLVSKQSCYLPHSLISLNSSSLRQDHGFFQVTSNGLASGNCLDEAICHGLYEIIERDAVSKFNQMQPAMRDAIEVDVESILHPKLVWLLECFRRAQIKVQIWDITTSIGIPSFCCQIMATNELRWLGKFFGSGTHLDKEIALMRALTEAAQSRLTLISGSRDDVFPERYQPRVAEDKIISACMEEAALNPQQKDFATCVAPDFATDFAANLSQILTALQQNGYQQIYLVDHTKPEFNLAVVQVFVLGMYFKK